MKAILYITNKLHPCQEQTARVEYFYGEGASVNEGQSVGDEITSDRMDK